MFGSGAGRLTISGTSHSRVFDVSQGGLAVTIAGLTITNGLLMGPVVQGGGIYVVGGTVTLTGCTLSNNEANAVAPDVQTIPVAQGGGIYVAGGTVTLTGCTLSNNTAMVSVNFSFVAGGDGSGGGVYVADGRLVVNDSTFDHNRTIGGPGRGGPSAGPGGQGLGGGIYLADGNLQINASALNSNQAAGGVGGGASGAHGGAGGTGSGGGVYVAGGGLEVNDSTLASNQTTGGMGGRGTLLGGDGGPAPGGGLLVAGGSATVDDSTFAFNSTTGGPGGMGAHVGPAGLGSGGGIANSGTLTLTGATLSGNAVSPTGSGGGLAALAGGTTTIHNTIVAADSAPSSPDVAGTVTSLGHNLIGDDTGGSGFTDTDLVGTTDAPIDPQLETLGDYGGPTPTMRPLPTSPAVDAGDNSDAPATDQRGFDRIVNGTIDIGAVELQPDELGGASRLRRPSRASSSVMTEVATAFPTLAAGRPRVLPVGGGTPPRTGAAAPTAVVSGTRSGTRPDERSVDHHRLDVYFQQLLEGQDRRGRRGGQPVLLGAVDSGLSPDLVSGTDHVKDLATLLG